MNRLIKERLGIIPDTKVWDMNWWWRSNALIDHSEPVWKLVDEVLKKSDIYVVYSGHLDILCNTAGALRWINKLTWDGKKEFGKAERKVLTNPDTDVLEML